jgi:hypothetical protein
VSTRTELSSKIRQFLNDSGYFYSESDINDSIQDGYDEVAALSGCIEKVTSISFTLNTVYYDMRSLISDYISVVGIWNRRVKRWLTPVSLRQLDGLSEKWEITTSEPFAFCPVNYRYIAVFPAIAATGSAATNKMYIVYKAAAETLIASSEPAIPLSLQEDILNSYVSMDMFEQAEEWTKAQEHFKSYLEKGDELKSLISKRDSERLVRLGGSL